ncbi:extracellular solute-binding protein [Paenibacillus sp. OV219]|uniref:extracellular solute-binding protein n=1 Tax=Paenibacillus sp. OV219 TaxID=1884377 RepID=UPI0008CDB6A8|nr:extracellular solute-binding protein [Paenibacillus sp. OV219]SEO05069.1 ABC-type glycerol-3-phosphate transport system, substrate-binding protein [Paenibacillus sp. OV219]
MRKLSVVFIALVVLGALLYQYAAKFMRGNAEDQTATGSNNQTVMSADAEAQPVEITIWDSTTKDEFIVRERAEFLKLHPNIRINAVVHEGDGGADFYQGVAAGNAPDLVVLNQALMDKYVRAGIIAPLDRYFASWGESKYFIKKWLDYFMYNGQLYGLPGESSTIFFGYNKRLFREAGIAAPPQTWAEMLEDAKKLTIPAKQQYGYNILASEWCEWWFQYYVWQAGGDLTKQNPDGTLKLTFTDPAVVKAAEFYQQLMKAHVTQTDLSMKFDALLQAFAKGKAAMMPFASDWVAWAVSLGADINDIGLAPFPKGPGGTGMTGGGPGCWAINAKTTKEKQDAAWAYISFVSSKGYITEEQQNLAEINGAANPVIIPRTDFTIGNIVKIDPDLLHVLKVVELETRPEFYGKGVVGKYVDHAVQRIVSDPNVKPFEEFKRAQEQAEKEVLSDFNKDILSESN